MVERHREVEGDAYEVVVENVCDHRFLRPAPHPREVKARRPIVLHAQPGVKVAVVAGRLGAERSRELDARVGGEGGEGRHLLMM